MTFGGVMLPSYAHGEVELARTLATMGEALQVVAAAERADALERYVEIPPLP